MRIAARERNPNARQNARITDRERDPFANLPPAGPTEHGDEEHHPRARRERRDCRAEIGLRADLAFTMPERGSLLRELLAEVRLDSTPRVRLGVRLADDVGALVAWDSAEDGEPR